jgi:hypothetical protein
MKNFPPKKISCINCVNSLKCKITHLEKRMEIKRGGNKKKKLIFLYLIVSDLRQ